ncbi:MAG: hypothetical protein Q7J45_04435 [bacterium]|nr:hypothetical protein [bacterium]
MSGKHLSMVNKGLRIAISILTLGVSMVADAGLFGIGGASWKEEVQLHDGTKVVVNRTQTRGGRHEIGQETPIDRHTIIFNLPRTDQAVIWETESGSEPEKSSLILLALDVVGGVSYVVTTPAGCVAYNKWQRPNPPYVVFKFEMQAWQRVALADFPAQIKEANVVIGTLIREKQLTDHPGVLPATEVRRLNEEAKNPDVRYLREFVRQPIKVAQTVDCPDLNSSRYTSPKAPFPIAPPSGTNGSDK